MQYVYNLPLERKKTAEKSNETLKPRIYIFLIRQNIKVKENKTGKREFYR